MPSRPSDPRRAVRPDRRGTRDPALDPTVTPLRGAPRGGSAVRSGGRGGIGDARRYSPHGRSVSIHPDAQLLAALRERQQTPAGRAASRRVAPRCAALRERVQVEHDLAHSGAWHGDRARYRGQRKNLFDLRRTCVVTNLHVLQRLPDVTALPQAA